MWETNILMCLENKPWSLSSITAILNKFTSCGTTKTGLECFFFQWVWWSLSLKVFPVPPSIATFHSFADLMFCSNSKKLKKKKRKKNFNDLSFSVFVMFTNTVVLNASSYLTIHPLIIPPSLTGSSYLTTAALLPVVRN